MYFALVTIAIATLTSHNRTRLLSQFSRTAFYRIYLSAMATLASQNRTRLLPQLSPHQPKIGQGFFPGFPAPLSTGLIYQPALGYSNVFILAS
jgi:hypothetical protein